MSDYTPTTEEVSGAYNFWLQQCSEETVEEITEKFDRWLDKIRAQAWEEGCRWGAVEFQTLDGKLDDETKVQVTDADNPYRQRECSENSNFQPTTETPNYLNPKGEEQ